MNMVAGGDITSGASLFDTETLEALARDIGRDGVIEVVRMFLEDVPLRMTAVRHALADRVPSAMRREVHAIAGTARIVGALRLADAAYAMQLTLEAREPDAGMVESLAALADQSLAAAMGWEAPQPA